jgi:hypothetical protein
MTTPRHAISTALGAIDLPESTFFAALMPEMGPAAAFSGRNAAAAGALSEYVIDN